MFGFVLHDSSAVTGIPPRAARTPRPVQRLFLSGNKYSILPSITSIQGGQEGFTALGTQSTAHSFFLSVFVNYHIVNYYCPALPTPVSGPVLYLPPLSLQQHLLNVFPGVVTQPEAKMSFPGREQGRGAGQIKGISLPGAVLQNLTGAPSHLSLGPRSPRPVLLVGP